MVNFETVNERLLKWDPSLTENLFHKMLRIIEPVFDRIWDLAVAIPFTAMNQPSKAERLKSSTGPSPTAVEFCHQKTFFSHWRYRNGPSPQRDKWGTPQNTCWDVLTWDEQSLKQTEFSSSMVLLYHPCCRTPTFGTDSFRDMHFAFLTRACSFSPLNLFSFLKEFPSWRFFRQKWFLFSRFRLNLSACSS